MSFISNLLSYSDKLAQKADSLTTQYDELAVGAAHKERAAALSSTELATAMTDTVSRGAGPPAGAPSGPTLVTEVMPAVSKRLRTAVLARAAAGDRPHSNASGHSFATT